MRKIAVTACDLKAGYYFHLPIVARLWKQAGYELLCMQVGDIKDWANNAQASYARQEALRAGMELYSIPYMHPHLASTVAQVSRLYASFVPGLAHGDYLLTTDADLWPLSKDWYSRQDWTKAIHLTYADAYVNHGVGTRYPMSHIGAKVGVWHHLMQPASMNPILALKSQLDQEFRNRDVSSYYGNTGKVAGVVPLAVWCYDEELISKRIALWPQNHVQKMTRGGNPPANRFKRKDYDKPVELEGKVDAHMKKATPVAYFENHFRPVAERVLPNEIDWVHEYLDEFASLEEANQPQVEHGQVRPA